MPPIPFRKSIAAALAVSMLGASLSGCVSDEQIQKTKGVADSIETSNQKTLAAYQDSVHQRESAIEREEDVDMPYIAGAPVAISRDATLPLALRNKVVTTLPIKSGTVPIAQAVAALQEATGIQFRVESDVYLPESMLRPKSQQQATVAAATAARPAQVSAGAMPPLPVALAMPVATAATGDGERLNVTLPDDGKPRGAVEYADLIANQLGINWSYDTEKGVGRFYRLVTKTYRVPVGAGQRSFTNEFKQSTQQVNSTSGGAATASTTPDTLVKMENQDQKTPLQHIVDQLDPIMTQAGHVAFNEDTGTITLRDTQEAVEQADYIVKRQLAVLSKIVKLDFQAVQVTVNDNGEKAVNWALAVEGALRNVPGLSFGASPAALTDSNVGSVGVSVLSGAFQGSSLVVQALNEIGHASSSINVPFTMRNRRGATWDSGKLFYFLSGSTGAVGAVGGSGGVPGYTLSGGSVGFKLFLYPDADDNNTVNLSVAFDSSVLDSLPTVTTGNGVNQQSFQTPNISRNGVGGQEVPIRDGQTILLTGFDQTTNNYDKRTMGDKVPLLFGGSLTAQHQRTFTLVFATVHIVDEGYGL